MKQALEGLGRRILDGLAERIAQRIADSGRLSDDIAYRVAMETIVTSASNKAPTELFHGISEGFWFWLCTEGYWRHPSLQAILPGLPDEAIQLNFTAQRANRSSARDFVHMCYARRCMKLMWDRLPDADTSWTLGAAGAASYDSF